MLIPWDCEFVGAFLGQARSFGVFPYNESGETGELAPLVTRNSNKIVISTTCRFLVFSENGGVDLFYVLPL
jgi:hypothetical protein